MQENSVRVIARVLAYPEAAVQVRAILSALIEPTRNEPGCISYELLQNQINPADFTFIEAWESNAAIDSHLSAKHVSDALTNLAGLISGEPGGNIQIRRHSVANAREPRN